MRAENVLKTWDDDTRAAMILKAASNPASTSTYPQLTSTTVLPMLAPASASARLLALARPLDLSGLGSIKLPYIGQSGRPVAPFIAEEAPAPVVDLTFSAVTLGPTRKILLLTSITREMQAASPVNAEVVLSDALAVSAAQSLDAALFSANAGTATAPPGLLFGVTPIVSAAKTGAEGVADDLGALAGAIGSAGINPDDAVFITTPTLATKIRVLASPKFTNAVFSSSSLAAGVVIAIVPDGLATGYDGGVEVDASTEATVHFEATTPLAIVDGAGVVAAPTYSAFQQDVSILRIRGDVAWAMHPGAIAEVTGAAW